MKPLIIRRAMAWYIDYCIAGIFTISVSQILGIGIRLGNIEDYINLVFLQFVCFIVYNLFAELLFKKTIAKRWLKLEIKDSGKEGFVKRVIFRNLIKLIPFEIISFLFSKNATTWHEQWSSIHTVKVH